MYTNDYKNVFRKVFSSAPISEHLNIYYLNAQGKIRGEKFHGVTYFIFQHMRWPCTDTKDTGTKAVLFFFFWLVSCVFQVTIYH